MKVAALYITIVYFLNIVTVICNIVPLIITNSNNICNHCAQVLLLKVTNTTYLFVDKSLYISEL